MENSEFKAVRLTRRKFLLAATNAGMLGAAVLVARRGMTIEVPAAAPAAADPPAGGGYRETEHIRKYYRCARYW